MLSEYVCFFTFYFTRYVVIYICIYFCIYTYIYIRKNVYCIVFFFSFFLKKGRFQDELHVRKRYFRMNLHTGTVLNLPPSSAVTLMHTNTHTLTNRIRKKENPMVVVLE